MNMYEWGNGCDKKNQWQIYHWCLMYVIWEVLIQNIFLTIGNDPDRHKVLPLYFTSKQGGCNKDTTDIPL